MPDAARIFVSHNKSDIEWCNEFVSRLRQYGANVWYDEYNLGYEELGLQINAELIARPIFVAVLSPTAIASRWVDREVTGAIALKDKDTTGERILLFVIAKTCEIPPLWSGFPRYPKQSDEGLTPAQAAKRLADHLKLSGGPAATGVGGDSAEAVEDLWWEGRSQAEQRHFEEALQLFDRALALDPTHVKAWISKGNVLKALTRYQESLKSYEQALYHDPSNKTALFNHACILHLLNYLPEALAEFKTFLAAEPGDREAWNNQGKVLADMGQLHESQASYERALSIDSRYENAWNNLIELLGRQGLTNELFEAQRKRDIALQAR